MREELNLGVERPSRSEPPRGLRESKAAASDCGPVGHGGAPPRPWLTRGFQAEPDGSKEDGGDIAGRDFTDIAPAWSNRLAQEGHTGARHSLRRGVLGTFLWGRPRPSSARSRWAVRPLCVRED